MTMKYVCRVACGTKIRYKTDIACEAGRIGFIDGVIKGNIVTEIISLVDSPTCGIQFSDPSAHMMR